MRSAARTESWDEATILLLVVGLVPLVGLVLLGDWPRWEVGAGTAVSLFALHELVWPR
jgi:hypothetical protein